MGCSKLWNFQDRNINAITAIAVGVYISNNCTAADVAVVAAAVLSLLLLVV